jgi:glutamate-1-semialdehyde 2,1-aminomutase
LRSAAKPLPIFFTKAQGAHLWDVDGNIYIDYLLGYGPMILGHCHPAVEEAVIAQLRRGSTYGGQHVGEIELCRRITRLVPCAERVALVCTGSEAVQAALRLARAFTGRSRVLRFEGHYHGWIDTIHVSPSSAGAAAQGLGHRPAQAGQSAAAQADVLQCPWNDLDALERVFATYGEEIAAAICEPVLCNGGVIAPAPQYLEELKRLCHRHGALLIFDEVITGFRLALGGAQERFGIIPDLCVLGKALGGGFPLSAVAGRADVFEPVADGRVAHLGTFNGNAVCTAAGIATLDVLTADAGVAYTRMEAVADRLVACLHREAAAAGLPLVVNHVGPVFHVFFTDLVKVTSWRDTLLADADRMGAFAAALATEGVWVRSNGLWYVSLAHGATEVAETETAISRAMQAIAGRVV